MSGIKELWHGGLTDERKDYNGIALASQPAMLSILVLHFLLARAAARRLTGAITAPAILTRCSASPDQSRWSPRSQLVQPTACVYLHIVNTFLRNEVIRIVTLNPLF